MVNYDYSSTPSIRGEYTLGWSDTAKINENILERIEKLEEEGNVIVDIVPCSHNGYYKAFIKYYKKA